MKTIYCPHPEMAYPDTYMYFKESKARCIGCPYTNCPDKERIEKMIYDRSFRSQLHQSCVEYAIHCWHTGGFDILESFHLKRTLIGKIKHYIRTRRIRKMIIKHCPKCDYFSECIIKNLLNKKNCNG